MYHTFGLDPKKDEEIIRAYNNVFTGGDGPIVLEHMLTELGFFDTEVGTEAERIRQDYAKRLLVLMGIWDNKNITESFVKLPVIYPRRDKGDAESV